ncbi:MAG: SdpI family protein [Pseudonocardia sp.]
MSETLRLVAGALLAGAGGALLTVAVLGGRSQLPRNRFAGVRTAATLRSEAAFALAQQVAAAPLAAAGAVAAAGGAVALLAAPGAPGWVVLVLAAVGALVLAGVGGAAGDRAAARLAGREPAPSACSGTCAGCDLVAGCHPDVAGS